FAEEVVVIHRRQGLRAEKIIQKKAKENKKISFMLDSVVKEIKGNDFVEKLSIENVKTSDVSEHPFDGVFVFIGYNPENKLIKNFAKLSGRGRVITDGSMSTKTPGLFAAGDIREKPVNQVSTAVGDGATAAVSAEHYISESVLKM
ncbi:MAG: NAD(P)/FAD-dependent oxidoreductase, partial [bacterium]